MWAILVGCAKVGTTTAPTEPVPGPAGDAVAGVQSPALAAILADHWDATMARSPEWATLLGDHRYDDRLGPRDGASVTAWMALEEGWAMRLATLDDAMLGPQDRVTRDLLLGVLRSDLATSICRFHEWSLSARSNALVDVNSLAEDTVVSTPADGKNLVARYRAMPRAIDDQIANLRAGLASGRVGVKDSLVKVVQMLDHDPAQPMDQAPLGSPARAEHADWSQQDLATFRTDLLAAADGVRAALERYRAVVRDELVPAGRTGADVGVHAMPDGDACYAATIRQETTLDTSADALHATGLAELDKIHAELEVLGQKVFGTDDLPAIITRLRTDPQLHFTSSDEIRATAERALRRAEAAVPNWFGRVPASPCTVDAIPAYLAPYTTVAYYQPVRPDGTKPGIYYVNVLAPETRARHEAEVLAFHESVPGHHLQIALAQEQRTALPAFRRYMGATAFTEGWALYVERLADEMGLYSGDVDRLGMLSFDTWRAARLVVDTGIHAKGWTREQAITFMLENTPLAENNVVNEVDRYVTWPGQALAYKTGQLEIRRLRTEAEAELGDAFAIAAFHDVVLEGGAVSLPVLSDRVHDWIDGDAERP